MKTFWHFGNKRSKYNLFFMPPHIWVISSIDLKDRDPHLDAFFKDTVCIHSSPSSSNSLSQNGLKESTTNIWKLQGKKTKLEPPKNVLESLTLVAALCWALRPLAEKESPSCPSLCRSRGWWAGGRSGRRLGQGEGRRPGRTSQTSLSGVWNIQDEGAGHSGSGDSGRVGLETLSQWVWRLCHSGSGDSVTVGLETLIGFRTKSSVNPE